MRKTLTALTATALLATAFDTVALAQPTTTANGTQLSHCVRNALIGAGVGAVTGALAGSRKNRGENAAIGAAVAGGGTFAVCKYLDNRQRARIEGAYQNALSTNAPVGMNWVGASSRSYVLNVDRPTPVAGNPTCRNVNATLDVNGAGAEALPTETYCRSGRAWTPAGY